MNVPSLPTVFSSIMAGFGHSKVINISSIRICSQAVLSQIYVYVYSKFIRKDYYIL
jgi:hypothetical protein